MMGLSMLMTAISASFFGQALASKVAAPQRPVASQASFAELDSEAGVVAMASDGSFSVRQRLTRSESTASMSSASNTQVFGFKDTCTYGLYWFGFKATNECRDSAMPELENSNCRCQRQGVALPVKYCSTYAGGSAGTAVLLDSNYAKSVITSTIGDPTLATMAVQAARAGALLEAANGTSASHRDALKQQEQQEIAHQASGELNDEVYGVCDVCCFKARRIAYEVILFPTFCMMLCCCGCGCLFKVVAEKNKAIKDLDEVKQETSRMSQQFAETLRASQQVQSAEHQRADQEHQMMMAEHERAEQEHEVAVAEHDRADHEYQLVEELASAAAAQPEDSAVQPTTSEAGATPEASAVQPTTSEAGLAPQ